MVKLADIYTASSEAMIQALSSQLRLLSTHSELLIYIASIITKITYFSSLKCLERYYKEILHPAAEQQPTTFIFGNKGVVLPCA